MIQTILDTYTIKSFNLLFMKFYKKLLVQITFIATQFLIIEYNISCFKKRRIALYEFSI